MIELHGPETQLHFIRRLVIASTLSSSSVTNPPSSLVIKLLCAEVSRISKDPILAEKFKDSIISSEPPNSTEVLSTFSLEILFAVPSLGLSNLEKLIFLTPFLSLLSSNSVEIRNLGKSAVGLIREVMGGALEQLGVPANGGNDLPELSPLGISKLFSILLSDLIIPLTDGGVEEVFNDEERRSIIMNTVRGRLGAEIGSQTLSHALLEMKFDESNLPTVVEVLVRICPALALCSLDLVRGVLNRFGKLNEGDESEKEEKVAKMLMELVELATKDTELAGSIDLFHFIKSIHEILPSLKWSKVIKVYDDPNYNLPDSWGLRLFAAFLPICPTPSLGNSTTNLNGLICGLGGDSAIAGLWSEWNHSIIQFNLIERLVYLPIDSFNLSNLSSITKVVRIEDGLRASPTVKALVGAVVNSPWNCKELVGVLVKMGSDVGELGGRVRELLERAVKSSPELVLIALVQLEVSSKFFLSLKF